MVGLADLANNLASATKSLAVSLGLANPKPGFTQFPDQAITSTFQKEHWFKNPSQGLYAFSVESVNTGTVSEFPAAVDNIKSLFDSNSGFFTDTFGEFKLPISPQEITQTEDFAVTIKPTQGGTVVNHSGNKYKTLMISGTTGVQPYKGTNPVDKFTGNVFGQPDELKYRSGYEVFQHFRNWMKSYHEMKSKPGNATMRMLFRNYKDWEFTYVEPIKFTMKRSATKPLLYEYTIQFKVLGHHIIEKPLFELVVSKLNNVASTLRNSIVILTTKQSVIESITGSISALVESLNNIKLAVKSAAGIEMKLADVKKDTIKNFLSNKEALYMLGKVADSLESAPNNTATLEAQGVNMSLLPADPKSEAKSAKDKALANPNSDTIKSDLFQLLAKAQGLLDTLDISILSAKAQQKALAAQAEAALLSKIEIQKIQTDCKAIYDKLSEGLGLGDASYNSIFGLTNTSVENTAEVTDDQFEALYALNQSISAIDEILSGDDLFDTNTAIFSQSDASNGADTIGQGIFSFPDPNSGIKEGYLPDGITLEQLALQELGDSSRWTEIAELNNLKAPYIVGSANATIVNYYIKSDAFYNPTDIKDIGIGYLFVITTIPTPAGAWLGKAAYIAEFLGGDKTVSSNWRFVYPEEGTIVQLINSQEYLKFENSEWAAFDLPTSETDGVLQPGDKIKIPSVAIPAEISIPGPRDNAVTTGLSASEKALAVDLKLTEELDLDLTPAGDLNLSYGVDNGAQAIVLKLLYHPGSLIKFPNIGTHLSPGKKVPDIAIIRSDIMSSLLADGRIKDVRKINIFQDNNTVYINFEVIFKNIQEPIPITIPV